jgi:lysophospholipase L1-like esterase
MSTKLKKKVIDGIAPVTLASCVMMGDGTAKTLEQFLADYEAPEESTPDFHGKTLAAFGDSITSTKGGDSAPAGAVTYPQAVGNLLGMTVRNHASSGSNAVRMREIITGADLSNVDIVTIMIGHNCGSQTNGLTKEGASIADIPQDGTAYTDYPNLFYADVGASIAYIQQNYPDVQIYLLTPLQAPDRAATIRLARTALQEIAALYCLPIIDVYAKSGINYLNIDTYTYDRVHPNQEGIAKIAECVVAGLIER